MNLVIWSEAAPMSNLRYGHYTCQVYIPHAMIAGEMSLQSYILQGVWLGASLQGQLRIYGKQYSL